MTSRPSPGGGLVLDIGGDVGALVVYLDGPMPSGELHAQPTGRPGGRFHTGVHQRVSGGRLRPVAVFPAVAHGEYEILGPRDEPVAAVAVSGGQVTELHLESTTA